MAIDDVGELGTVLAVFAHPDDEAYLAGGIMAAAVAAGQRVVCVTATRGELGTPDPEAFPPERMGAIREAELTACLGVLGVTEHRWLAYADGGCADVDPAPAVDAVAAIVADVRPDTVLTFGPDGMTWHPDHIAVGAWTTAAVARAGGGARLYYATKTPDWYDELRRHMDPRLVMMTDDPPPRAAREELAVDVRLAGADLDRKVAALRCQTTQVEPLYELVGAEAFARLVRDEPYVRAGGAGDGLAGPTRRQ